MTGTIDGVDFSEITEITIDGTPVTELTVDGVVEWPVGPTITTIDTFDSGFTAGWTGEMADFAQTATSYDGGGAVMTSGPKGALEVRGLTGSGLQLFPKGNEMWVYSCPTIVGTDGAQHIIEFAVADDSNRWYVQLQYHINQVRILRISGGSASERADVSTTFTANTFYRVEIVRDDGTLGGLDNDITVRVRDMSTDTVIFNWSENDSANAANEGIGHYTFNLNPGAVIIDHQHLVG